MNGPWNAPTALIVVGSVQPAVSKKVECPQADFPERTEMCCLFVPSLCPCLKEIKTVLTSFYSGFQLPRSFRIPLWESVFVWVARVRSAYF